MARRDARRGKALAHNEVAAARQLELEASAEAARDKLVQARQAMTTGLAPEEIRAIDAARDAELDRARVIKSVLQERRARQPEQGRDRGLDRDGPGLGF